MALTIRQTEEIAADAVNLRDALMRKGVDEELAGDWVGAAMDALVINVTDQPGGGEDDENPWEGNPFAAPELRHDQTVTVMDLKGDPEAARRAEILRKYAPPGPSRDKLFRQLGNVTARTGNLVIDPRQGLAGVDHWAIERLALGPEHDGEDMRLVAVTPDMVTTWSTEHIMNAAGQWVIDNVPGADLINAENAGQDTSGNPVYLVTYKTAEPLESAAGPYHWMTPEQRARWGQYQPDWWPSLRGEFPERMKSEPAPGQDFRLAVVSAGEGKHPHVRDRATRYVRATVPEAGRIISVEDAGVTPDGTPVYLVTYELAAGGDLPADMRPGAHTPPEH